jgi:signal transduction histidine kinase
MELIGKMAAGIGHEIRNPMTTVRGFLQILAGKQDCSQYKEFYHLMISELDRANSIITEFLSLAKNKKVELKTQNLNQIVDALFPLISADGMVADKHIEIELGKLPDIKLDEKEIRQLILNLVRNGLEAMTAGGKLTIRTFQDGDTVVLAVQDQGVGIKPNVLEKIGAPFFSTKDSGTGLGLAVCFSIANRHNATIKVETGPGGTTFFTRFDKDEREPIVPADTTPFFLT